MLDPIAIVFSDTCQSRLKLEVLQRSFPDKDDYFDGNQLNVWFELEAGAFTCKQSEMVRVEVFQRFHGELQTLYRDLRGTATLSTFYEKWLELVFTGDGRGHFDIACQVQDREGNTLRTRLWLDQTYLPPILDQLAQVAVAYPLQGR